MDIIPTEYELSKNLIYKILSHGSVTEDELNKVLESIEFKANGCNTLRHPFIMMSFEIDSIRSFHVISMLNKSFTFIDNFTNYTNVSLDDIDKFMKKNNITMHKNLEKSHYDISECMICLETIDKIKYNDLITLSCLHYYHAECIDKWLKKSSECPICKQSIYKIALNEWFDVQHNKWINDIYAERYTKHNIRSKTKNKMCIIS